jgi:hypothetical protein
MAIILPRGFRARKYPATIGATLPVDDDNDGSYEDPGATNRQEAAVQTITGPIDATARARLLAVEVLLAEPELLGDDVLEAALYIQRGKLTGDWS